MQIAEIGKIGVTLVALLAMAYGVVLRHGGSVTLRLVLNCLTGGLVVGFAIGMLLSWLLRAPYASAAAVWHDMWGGGFIFSAVTTPVTATVAIVIFATRKRS